MLTAFFAATIAVAQNDIKKVLAYSTISQLGFMFLALGVGAYGVAIFHVYTHAFFKACLFLGAGSVIHALSGEQDIRKMGGLARKIPVTFVDLRRGDRRHRGHPAARRLLLEGRDPLVRVREQPRRLAAALGRRLRSRRSSPRSTCSGCCGSRSSARSRMDPETEHHVHESPWSMTGVLVVLAVLSAVGGFFALPHFLEPLLPLPDGASRAALPRDAAPHRLGR